MLHSGAVDKRCMPFRLQFVNISDRVMEKMHVLSHKESM